MTRVITYGSFDLFHQGHYNLLKRAKALGDYLIVGITTEQYDLSRGKLNVVDSLIQRIDNVRATGLVDEIIIEDHAGQKVEDIQKYDIDIFTVGSDWVGKFDYLEPLCKVVYLERTKDISSTMLRQKGHELVTFGIIGTGRIAKRFVSEIRFVSGATINNVYNPHLDSAVKFAKELELNKATNDIKDFYEGINAVYIASPHETHYSYVKDALLNGKNVLCEKPLCFKKSEAEELYALAKERGLLLLEAIKTAYAPGFNQLLNIAKSGEIGEIKDVESCFTRLTSPDKREMKDAEYGGSFTEFGSYTVLPFIKLLGTDYKRMRAYSIFAENGIDIYSKVSISYDDAFALSKTGLQVKSEGQLVVAGTKGYILAESPWWLTKGFEVRYEDASKINRHNTIFLGNGLRYEISEFVSNINKHKTESYMLTPEESIAIAGIMEQFMNDRKEIRQSVQRK